MVAEVEGQDWSDERRAFLERRQRGIGATDAAAILGLSPWSSPLKVYHDKINPPEPQEPSLPAWLGLKLQATVAELYSAQQGVRLRADNRHHAHPQHPYLVCHLDYRRLGEPKHLVEIKTSRWMKGWGDVEKEEVPIWYWTQCQHEMLVTGAEVCDLAVLFGHHEFRVYPVRRNAEFLERYVEAARAFWHDNVLARVEPEPTGAAFDRALIKARWPEDTEPLKAVTPEQEEVVARLRLAATNADQAEAAFLAIKTRVQDLIGDAAGIQGSFGRITWRRNRDRTITDWEEVARSYRIAIQDARGMLPEAQTAFLDGLDLDAIESIYTRSEPGARVFRMQWKDDTDV